MELACELGVCAPAPVGDAFFGGPWLEPTHNVTLFGCRKTSSRTHLKPSVCMSLSLRTPGYLHATSTRKTRFKKCVRRAST